MCQSLLPQRLPKLHGDTLFDCAHCGGGLSTNPRFEKSYHLKPPRILEKNVGYHHLSTHLLHKTQRALTCRALVEGVRRPLDGARLVKCSEKPRTLQEHTSSERGPDDLDLRLLQEVKTNQDPIQKTSD